LDKQILGIELVRQDISKPYLAPPNVPPANLAILRGAFHSCLEDADFTAEVKQRHLEMDRPMDGEELAALVARVSQTPAAAVKKLQDLLSGFHG
jgi:tripartite-type tricarboxylate transporter receptor subunit TctC